MRMENKVAMIIVQKSVCVTRGSETKSDLNQSPFSLFSLFQYISIIIANIHTLMSWLFERKSFISSLSSKKCYLNCFSLLTPYCFKGILSIDRDTISMFLSPFYFITFIFRFRHFLSLRDILHHSLSHFEQCNPLSGNFYVPRMRIERKKMQKSMRDSKERERERAVIWAIDGEKGFWQKEESRSLSETKEMYLKYFSRTKRTNVCVIKNPNPLEVIERFEKRGRNQRFSSFQHRRFLCHWNKKWVWSSQEVSSFAE